MDARLLSDIRPFVRVVRERRDLSLTGKWQDFDHVFTMVTNGEADFVIDGVHYLLGRGNVILIPPYMTHIILNESGQPLEQKIFHFDFYRTPERVAMQSEDVLLLDRPKIVPEPERLLGGKVIIAKLEGEQLAVFEDVFERMRQEYANISGGLGSQALLQAYSTVLIISLLRNAGRPEDYLYRSEAVKTKSWLHIENALEFINRHYMEEDMSNERIAEAIGVSPNYLTKRFHSNFGIPLHRYVIRMRIEKAQQMLNLGKCNITEAASATGFSSIHVFSKTFRTVTGMSPSAYMESIADEKSRQRNYYNRSTR